jgi:N6-adenosine-specific RNA methylase IME4
MRKVANRLEVLEERYKDLPPKERARKINAELMNIFCVGQNEVIRWKSIVNIMKRDITNIGDEPKLPPSHYLEIARLPEEKQKETIEEVAKQNLTYKQTALLVDKVLGKDPIPLPEGKFQTIVVDPPWPVEKILRDVRPNQVEFGYRTMSVDEIKVFPIQKLMADNCHVYLWTTQKFLPIAFEVFESWGVKYECLLTWVKNVGFTPFSWMYSTEHVLFGRIGSLELLKKGERLDFNAKVREHSRKPNEFYELVKRVSPEPRKDVFAREKHDGFEAWGDEVDKFT